MNRQDFFLYSGEGNTINHRGLKLPLYEKVQVLNDPAFYIAEEGLCQAVNVSLALGNPLLVTGEPGTGKTQLASSIAYELGLSSPFIFHTKTTSTAKDIFYQYDALRHFHDSHFRQEKLSTESYIEYEALGLAILLTLESEEVRRILPENLVGLTPARSVVLIDEIDKAPRDLPNDILDEIDNMSFRVTETGERFDANMNYRPIVILTSNSEKNLPPAFLRRCNYYHIGFPDGDRLRKIARNRLQLESDFTEEMLNHAVQHFERIRELALTKRPATAEFLAWVRILHLLQLDVKNVKLEQKQALDSSYTVLAKSKEDREILRKTLINA